MNTKKLPQRPNFIILMTDQERAIRNFPPEWTKENLVSLERLRRTGMNYKRFYINTSPCWASRGVMISGYYPLINQVIAFGTTLHPDIANFSTVLKAGGYRVVYKGKWHLTKNFDTFSMKWGNQNSNKKTNQVKVAKEDLQMLTQYGLEGWTSPDMGTALVKTPVKGGTQPSAGSVANLGGGNGQNDLRVVTGEGMLDGKRQESALEFIRNNRDAKDPYCLMVSLVNPHDISVYPDCLEIAGYNLADFEHYENFELPKSFYEDDLSTKPWAQLNLLRGFDQGALIGPQPLNYLKFYAYLQSRADALLGMVLDEMTEEQRKNTIIIRTSDHGEMGMAHGGLREKMNTVYQETVHLPLIISNPVMFPEPVECDELVSQIDILPTLASLAGVDPDDLDLKRPLQGIDFSETLSDPKAPTQDAILGNFYTGENSTAVMPSGDANNICSITTKKWKYAVYFAVTNPPSGGGGGHPSNGSNGSKSQSQKTYPSQSPAQLPESDYTNPWIPEVDVSTVGVQYELYNLENDPNELKNLLPVQPFNASGSKPTVPESISQIQKELHEQLTQMLKDNDSLPEKWSLTTPSI